LFDEAEEVEDECEFLEALMGDERGETTGRGGNSAFPEPFLRGVTSEEGGQQTATRWDLGNMRVRTLDWEESWRLLEGPSASSLSEGDLRE
jgi:hypothetical protein